MRFVVLSLLLLGPLPLQAQPAPVGSPFLVHDSPAGDQGVPGVAVAADGRFVVVWGESQEGLPVRILVRPFDAQGVALRGESAVEVFTDVSVFIGPVVILNQETFLVVTHHVSDAGSQSIGRIFDFAGAFLVAWESSDGDGKGIYARRFDHHGTAVGRRFSGQHQEPQ